MSTIFILFLFLISSSCEEIKMINGPPGGFVYIRCPYDGHYADRPKYFCNTINDTGCDIIASNEENRKPASQRLNLTDYKQDKYFMVILSNLTVEDTGVYWCAAGGASPNDKPKLLMEVHVIAIPIYGDDGESATFRCPYAQGYQNNSKGFCKGACGMWGIFQIKSEQGQTQAKDRHFSLYDNTTARVFSVTISGLKTEYSGKYTCAVITGVNYVRTEQELVVWNVITGEEGGSINITCKSQKNQATDIKYLCRAKDSNHCTFDDYLVTSLTPNQDRYSLTENKHGGNFTVAITDLRAKDAGIYRCGQKDTKTDVRLRVSTASPDPTFTTDIISTRPLSSASMSPVPSNNNKVSHGSSPVILPVLLILVVIVLATAVFLLYRCRRNKTQDFSSDNANTTNNRQPDCMYEEIKDTHNPSDTAHPETSTVYATAQLPTMPSDDPTYCTAELSTDSSATMVYSSRSFNEGPNTAAVTLRQENCEYSMINLD